MKREQIIGACVLLALAAGTILMTSRLPEPAAPEEDAYQALLASTPLAVVEGETISPNQHFLVRTTGDTGIYVSGVRVPEKIQVVDRFTDEVLWETDGMASQSARWSPNDGYLALARSARTWSSVTVIETRNWTEWEFTLPDGSPIPEYTFLPDDWGAWQGENDLRLTVGRGGDGNPDEKFYTCAIVTQENGQITGETRERTVETLPGTYDFDHDGTPETVQLTIWWWPMKTGESLESCTLSVLDENGAVLWEEPDAALAHAGWRSVFACSIDGQDYLIRYDPSMYQGYAAYHYQVFSLDSAGKEQVLAENRLEWDGNFSSQGHEPLDIDALTDFLWEVHGYLKNSTLLMSTEDGVFQSDLPGLQLQYAPFGDLLPLESREALEGALRQWAAEW